jgi:hypothetical protein
VGCIRGLKFSLYFRSHSHPSNPYVFSKALTKNIFSKLLYKKDENRDITVDIKNKEDYP